MSKYSIDNTTLTAIADAIREKGGTTDPILTEGMAAAIAAIEAGGYASGSFTTADDITTNIVITHNLGVKPRFWMVYSTAFDTYTQSRPKVLSFVYCIQLQNSVFDGLKYQKPDSQYVTYETGNRSVSGTDNIGVWYYLGYNEHTITLKQNTISTTYGIGANSSFVWLAVI